MLPTIIIGALALAILWPFIKLGYELIKLAGSLVLLVASQLRAAASSSFSAETARGRISRLWSKP